MELQIKKLLHSKGNKQKNKKGNWNEEKIYTTYI